MRKSISPETAEEKKTLILGIGNLLMGDEGVGIHAVRRLETSDLAGRAELVDGGTGGFQLLPCFHDASRLILIDATADGKPPGTVSHLKPRFAHDFPRSLSAHDIGLRDLIEAAALTGELPHIDLVAVSIAWPQPMTLEVSKPVSRALAEVENLVRTLLDRED